MKHVQLVRACHGDKQFAFFDLGFGEDIAVDAVSAKSHDIVNIADLLDHFGIVVNANKIVSFVAKALHDGHSDFSAAYDDNFHGFSFLFVLCLFYVLFRRDGICAKGDGLGACRHNTSLPLEGKWGMLSCEVQHPKTKSIDNTAIFV